MRQVPSKVIAMVGSSGFDSGYGHLRRLVSLSSVLEYTNILCLHGNFEETNEFYNAIESSSELNKCKCNKQPDMVIFDSYSTKVLSSLEFKSSPKLIQLVDELSPKLWADAYIKASPTRDWKPLNELAPIKEFKNSPLDHANEIAQLGFPMLHLVGDADEVVPMAKGSVVVFPSCFLYPHRVDPITSGIRYSCVSWSW